MSDIDGRRVKQFAVSLLERYSAAMVTVLLDLGQRTGLTTALASGTATVDQLAERAGCDPRYTREWLGAMVTGGIVEHAEGIYTLPAEHAMCLVGDTFYNVAPMSRMVVNAAAHAEPLAAVARSGGGIGVAEFDDDVVGLIDRLNRPRYDTFLLDTYLPAADGLPALLEGGGRLVDIGCGSGHVACLIGARYPHADILGVDASSEAVARARDRAEQEGLPNVRFEVGDAAALSGRWDAVTAFDVVHDAANPREILRSVYAALRDDGVFLLYDSGAPSALDEQVGLPWAPFMYGLSLSYCLTVSLSEGGEGLGNMVGRERFEQLLAEAGFSQVRSTQPPGDPMNLIYACRR